MGGVLLPFVLTHELGLFLRLCFEAKLFPFPILPGYKMFNLHLNPSINLESVAVSFSENPQVMTAAELDEVIRKLAWVRAGLRPRHEPVELGPDTLISGVSAVCFQVTESDLAGHARLNILHPGFGWICIHLNQASFDKMGADARLLLRTSRTMQ